MLKGLPNVWVLVACCAAVGSGAVIGTLYFLSRAPLPASPAVSQSIAAGITQPAAPTIGKQSSSDWTAATEPALPGDGASIASPGVSLGSASEREPAVTPESKHRLEFDIVRVEPSGESVIAGRGTPGETIALVDGDAALASAVADARGEVVFLPPALPPGKHVLMLRATGTVPASASQSVAVVVPTKGGDAPGVTAVTSLPPARLSTIQPDIATPKAAAPTIAVATPPTKVAPAIAIKSVEAEDGGSFVATGLAPPGSQTRLYLNGAFLAKVMADVSGSWALKIEKGMQPGSYRVRADGVEPASGKVLARAEVPFVFPVPSPPPLPLAPLSAAEEGQPPSRSPLSSQELAAKEAPAVAATVLKEVRTATVMRGDSLWRISHKMLGRGIRYKQIYEANESQIRDPSLVFPGQIFVMPSNLN